MTMRDFKLPFIAVLLVTVITFGLSKAEGDAEADAPSADDAAAPPAESDAPPGEPAEGGGKDKKEKSKTKSNALKKCICSTEHQPVCGADGKTYGNECLLECRGLVKAKDGKCKGDKSGVSGKDAGKDSAKPGASGKNKSNG